MILLRDITQYICRIIVKTAVGVEINVVGRRVVYFISICVPRVWVSTKSIGLVIMASRSHMGGADA